MGEIEESIGKEIWSLLERMLARALGHIMMSNQDWFTGPQVAKVFTFAMLALLALFLLAVAKSAIQTIFKR